MDANNNPTETLRQYLSRKTLLDPTASAVTHKEANRERLGHQLEHIGEGFCATIYNFASTGSVIKQAKGWNKHSELWTDYSAHRLIYSAGSSKGLQVCIPQPAYFIAPEHVHTWYTRHRAVEELPDGPILLTKSTALLISERIPALPSKIREALIDTFCPKDQKVFARMSQNNRNCLLRIYLGRRRANTRVEDDFTLRNFEFTLDKMDMLGVDPVQFVAPIAEALAVMHWAVHCDAFDVEFVLGSPSRARTGYGPSADKSPSGIRTTWNQEPGDETNPQCLEKAVKVWLLDFNQVGKITLDEDGAEKAVRGFWDNDPYYPRPDMEGNGSSTVEAKLWGAFKDAYLTTSITLTDDIDLPLKFIKRVEEEGAMRAASGSMLQGPPKSSTEGKKKQRHYPGLS
ncbi:zinc finger protein-domain-containing protein [Colletotrichum cereale]|nr:zinc finger protein-domain-containing protein [Colletotrichum cereale]